MTNGLQVQMHWLRYTEKMDRMVEEAFRLNVKWSLQELSRAISGDGKSAPNPLLRVKVVLEGDKVRRFRLLLIYSPYALTCYRCDYWLLVQCKWMRVSFSWSWPALVTPIPLYQKRIDLQRGQSVSSLPLPFWGQNGKKTFQNCFPKQWEHRDNRVCAVTAH